MTLLYTMTSPNSFQALGLDTRILSNLPKNFAEPTPIQAQAIPPVLANSDVLGLAQTGTGKTAAFVLPILQRLLTEPASDSPRKGASSSVRALIVAPTRELVEQIHTVIEEIGNRLGIRSVTIYGGVNIEGQIKKLRRGAEIIVACPGRLLDHVNRRTVRLQNVEVLVLDEADQMFDMGFLPDIKRIVSSLPKVRQNLLFSATMPKEIEHLAFEILSNPVTVRTNHEAPLTTIDHSLFPVQQDRKSDLVLELLKKSDFRSVLVFARTKARAKRLGSLIARAGFSAASIEGSLSQRRRAEAMGGFRAGKYQVLVATDIAARGIDVASVSHVINYDMPDTVAAYTHRIGRTGRAAQSGEAFTLATREDRSMIRAIERALGKEIKREILDGYTEDPSVVASSFDGRGGSGRSSGGSRSRSSYNRRGGNRDSGSRQQSGGARSFGDRRGANGESSSERAGASSSSYRGYSSRSNQEGSGTRSEAFQGSRSEQSDRRSGYRSGYRSGNQSGSTRSGGLRRSDGARRAPDYATRF